jgi:hypothetical protein
MEFTTPVAFWLRCNDDTSERDLKVHSTLSSSLTLISSGSRENDNGLSFIAYTSALELISRMTINFLLWCFFYRNLNRTDAECDNCLYLSFFSSKVWLPTKPTTIFGKMLAVIYAIFRHGVGCVQPR